jgi:hypothetical protein
VTQGPWHPATHLELLHAAPAFAVIGVGLAFGLVAMRPGRSTTPSTPTPTPTPTGASRSSGG